MNDWINITPKGYKYVGGFVNNKREGEAEVYYNSGDHYIGEFKNNLR